MKDIDAGRVKVSSLNQLRISPPIEVYFDLKGPASERMGRRYTEPGSLRIQITKDMTESLKVIEKYSKKSYDELMKMYEDHYNEYSNDYSVEYSEVF